MGWVWALLAVLVVLVVAGVFVSRRRSQAVDDGPPTTGAPDPVEAVDGPDRARGPETVGLFDTAGVVDPSATAGDPGTGTTDDAAAVPTGPVDGGTTATAPAPEPDPESASVPSGPEDAATGTAAPEPVAPPTEEPDAAEAADTAVATDDAPAPSVPMPRAGGDPAPRPEDDPTAPDTDDEPSGRHALRDDVEPAPLPEPGPAPADDRPPAPLAIPTRPRQGTGGSALAALDSRIIGPSAASDPLPPGVRPGPYPDSVLAPTDGEDPPETHRVKVHSGSRRFHSPESPYYVRTRADLYFTAEGAARAAGFIAWHERPGAR